MLVVFSPIFVSDTKIVSRYDFVAPLMRIYVDDFHKLNVYKRVQTLSKLNDQPRFLKKTKSA